LQTFENEVAKTLCKTMKGIERPTLDQLNQTIVSNLCPVFLPKKSASEGRLFTLRDDVTHLCSHAGYKFLDVKLTPQTSNKSVAFTYDSWSTLLKTIQQMQMSGSASERNIKSFLKHALHTDNAVQGQRMRTDSSPSSMPLQNVARTITHTVSMDGSSVRSEHSYMSPIGGKGYASRGSHQTASPSEGADGVVRSLATVMTLHGSEATDKARQLQDHHYQYVPTSSEPHAGSATRGTPTSGAHHSPHVKSPSTISSGGKLNAQRVLQQQQQQPELQLHDLYYQSHAPLLSQCGVPPVQFCSTAVRLNDYERATSILSNNQSVLPLLQRAARGGAELFQEGAYLHQYAMYGLEEGDFQHAFLSLGCSIQNYIDL
jgi:hypothetical protein